MPPTMKKKRARELSKLRSKKFREKNKSHITELEEENQILRNRIADLEAKLKTYESKCNQTHDSIKEEPQFITDQEFGNNQLYNLLHSQTELVKLTMYDQLWQGYGCNSPSRK